MKPPRGGVTNGIMRRFNNPNFHTRYFVGNGIDIGSGTDSINNYKYMFPSIKSCREWDLKDGDATYMNGIEDNTFDFIHSSHCLEHLKEIYKGFENWVRICKKDGYIITVVPDEDLYEQGNFPSIYNKQHIQTLTIYKKNSWSPKSINIFDLIMRFGDKIKVEKIELIYDRYNKDLYGKMDQSIIGAECSIEFIVRKL